MSLRPLQLARALFIIATILPGFVAWTAGPVQALERHAIAMHGEPALPADFTHMPYANPDAPKGGRLVHGFLGTFDSLNPYIVRGIAIRQMSGFVIESLMTRGQNEPFTLYGLLAQTVETDDSRSFVTFRLNPNARFSDGAPVTADDVRFSWALLRDKGRPNHRQYYAKVSNVSVLNERTIRFDLEGSGDRELPLILGLMPILPRHLVAAGSFEETTLAPLTGSGPYRVTAVNPGNSVTLTRNPDYWGRDLPVNRGLWNFDEIRLDFYREANGHFEAFRRGLYDVRFEHEPLRWSEGYNFSAVHAGDVVLDRIQTGLPKPSEFLVFNTRRPVFADIRVREALSLLFDFEWVNRNYFFDLYTRSGGIFPGSELSAYMRAAGPIEQELLASDRLPKAIIDGSYRLPSSDGSGRDRASLRRALTLLDEAGFAIRDRTMRRKSNGEPLTFEILVTTRDQERIALAYLRDLKRAGITPSIRVVDAVQFDQRRLSYDFDMIQNRWDQSLSPGNEQLFYWGSEAADQPGTRNYMGAKSPTIDRLIRTMIETRDRPHFVASVRALDRAWMAGHYGIPLYHVREQWIARWNRIQRPETLALTGTPTETWWFKP